MKISAKQIICLMLLGLLLLPANASALSTIINSTQDIEAIDQKGDSIYYFIDENNEIKKVITNLPPLDDKTDYKITFTLKEIRAFDKIDIIGDPDFYVKIFVNDEQFKSKIWYNQKYVNETWSITVDIPDNTENVTIKIQLWDWNPGLDKLCDICCIYDNSFLDKRDVDIIYDLKTGHWIGDDFISPNPGWGSDFSGYGRLNGCDDGTYYKNDRDCELIFDITQNDEDGDGIPSWTEKYIYHTDPNVDNTFWDNDSDGVPIEWEWKWGNTFYLHYGHQWEYYWFYDPFIWEDHANFDPDEDGLQNTEEYLTSKWGSDPFRQDIFIELDQMEIGPMGQGGFLPELSKDLLRDAYGKRNIFLCIDDGYMGGGEKNIPFDSVTTYEEVQQLYQDYFLHNDANNWRRGIFHYAILVYNGPHTGYTFGNRIGDNFYVDSLELSTDIMEVNPIYNWPIYNIIRHGSFSKEYMRAKSYAGITMHELGHSLGLSGPGHGYTNHFKYRNYQSCMNYHNVYWLIDYSDGTHGKYDFDDWDAIDLTRFQKQSSWG